MPQLQDLTPEELDIVRQMIEARSAPGAAGSPTESYGGLPEARPAPVQTSPSAPYNAQAAEYKSRADALDKQAAEPAPQPHGFKENLVVALRNGLENFGRYGAPGGYYGQEEKRQKAFTDENKDRVTRATALRNEAQQQQQLGQTTDFQTGELKNQEGNLAVAQGNLARENRIAGQPKRVEVGVGGVNQATNPDTGKVLPDTEIKGTEKPAPSYNLESKVIQEGKDKYGLYAVDMRDNGRIVSRIGDAPAPTGAGGAGGLGLVQGTSTDASGNPVIGVTDLRSKTFTPAHLAGDTTGAPVATAAVGNNNLKVDAANSKMDQDRDASLKAMQGLVAQSRSNPNSAYINDQGLVDQFFNIVKPDSGARMNQAYIQNLLTPGPIADKVWAFAQKLGSGAPLIQADREYMVTAAQIVADAKRHQKTAGGVPATAAPAAGGSSTDSIRARLGLGPKVQ